METKYKRRAWSCGKMKLVCLIASMALLHVGCIYFLIKRLFLSSQAHKFICLLWLELFSAAILPYKRAESRAGPGPARAGQRIHTRPQPQLPSRDSTTSACTGTHTDHDLSNDICFGDLSKGLARVPLSAGDARPGSRAARQPQLAPPSLAGGGMSAMGAGEGKGDGF